MCLNRQYSVICANTIHDHITANDEACPSMSVPCLTAGEGSRDMPQPMNHAAAQEGPRHRRCHENGPVALNSPAYSRDDEPREIDNTDSLNQTVSYDSNDEEKTYSHYMRECIVGHASNRPNEIVRCDFTLDMQNIVEVQHAECECHLWTRHGSWEQFVLE